MILNRLKIWNNGRLEYYSKVADAQYWDSLWERQISKEFYEKYSNGELAEYDTFIRRYLTQDDRILEAGCGTGRFVVALLARGYKDVSGIDWGQKTISTVKSIMPELPIKHGDVTNIPVDDGYYDAYISLGVVEHRQAGPEPFLREAVRILKREGVALISVPYVNPLRKIKHRLGFYHDHNLENYDFYQYAFDKQEFELLLTKVGFKVVEAQGISGVYGIKEELPFLAALFNRVPGFWRIEKLLKKCSLLDRLGHMIMFVCIKQGDKD